MHQYKTFFLKQNKFLFSTKIGTPMLYLCLNMNFGNLSNLKVCSEIKFE